ncbi:hypothetical protein K461DRAFT_104875 [Myriangium duriaei CBS 260.36]|uniref:Uncharacterized protein n=1 Tax=Myriangium duriaei CBS 260.36 TaxID=1168546 RepID=A0A9P4J3V0_9PEZI|nr:hypothetical protein K461DRAFT_104875 [Myriangium duriaei CBS 260.36]
MADGQENDEDLFADLYDGDDTADVAPPAKTAPAPAAIPEAPAPIPEVAPTDVSTQAGDSIGGQQSYDDGAHQAYDDGFAQNGKDEDEEGHQAQHSQQFSNNQGQGSWQGQNNDDQGGSTIGTREDGRIGRRPPKTQYYSTKKL